MEMCQVQRLIGIPSTVKVDNDIYFHESYGNRIFKYSLEDEKLVSLAQSDCSPGKRLEYMGVSEKIYFFPYYAKRICIFDFQSLSVDYKGGSMLEQCIRAIYTRQNILMSSKNT